MRRRPAGSSLAAALLVLLSVPALAGCSAAGGAAPSGSRSPVTLTVLAAASLTDSFPAIATGFEAEHPGVTVTLAFGGSPALAEQILQGAPADVFAAASTATMATVAQGDAVSGAPEDFARNTLEIAVPPGNPGKVRNLADLGESRLDIALCAPEVPCGAAAQQAFAAAGITAAPDTLEQDVKSVLTKVRLGEVDAGLVYRTDVLAAGSAVTGIEFPESAGAATEYPIAVLSGSAHRALARQFVAYVLGDGQRVLQEAGFAAP